MVPSLRKPSASPTRLRSPHNNSHDERPVNAWSFNYRSSIAKMGGSLRWGGGGTNRSPPASSGSPSKSHLLGKDLRDDLVLPTLVNDAKRSCSPFSFHRLRHWKSIRKYCTVIALILMCCLVYVHLFGTFTLKGMAYLPPSTLIFTRPFRGLRSDNFPPEGWKPPFRVVVSLTTTPNRLDKVGDAINSLLHQSLPADTIYLSVPQGPMKRYPERSYEEAQVPSSIQDDPMVTVLTTTDYGPVTKLIPALEHENDPDTLIITVDDDKVYPTRLVESLAWEAYHSPDVALGVCGWGAMPVPDTVGTHHVYVPYYLRPRGRYVDVLQAVCGNAYRRSFFSKAEIMQDYPPVCVTVDDVWVAGVLAIEEEVPRAIVSKRLDPPDPEWKSTERKSTLKLSSYNHANEIHIKCIRAIEEKFQKPWKRVYQQ